MWNQKELPWLLAIAYVGFAEWASTWWSKLPLCVLVSENQTADDNTGQQACATLFEGIARLFRFLWESANHDNILSLGTILIAVFTLTLWRSTRALWEAGERQLRLIEAFSTRQATDTRILQRAYLAVDIAGINIMTRGDSTGHVAIRNAGHLPARNVSLFIDIRTSSVGTEKELPIGEIIQQNRALMPGATMTIGSPPLGREDFGGFKTGWVYVWGKVTYEDGFGQSRFTEFCHRYPIERREGDAVNGFGIAAKYGRYHEYGNDIG